jgi:hypothetical protein
MRLEISYGGGSTHEVELSGKLVVLGRDPACDIVLNDSKCSRRHAVLEDGPDGLVVRDSGSANGVYVNGRRVEKARLRPGDVIRLGDAQVKLLHELGQTVVMAPDDVNAGPMADEALADGPRRPATVSLLAALWALFVPASVAACLLATHRLGGGPVLWAAGSLASLVLAVLGTSMALGLRALSSWARHLQIGTAALGLLVCPFTLASATVLLYMTRPEVKAAFEGEARRRAETGNGAAEATFALSLVGMLILGLALTAIAVLVL